MIIVNNLKWNQLYIEGKYTLRRIFVNYGPIPLSFWPSFHISIVKSLKIVMSSKREKHTMKIILVSQRAYSINVSKFIIKRKNFSSKTNYNRY